MQFHCIKPRHSIELIDRIHVKGFGLLSFAKNMGESLNMVKNFLIVLKNLQQMQWKQHQKENGALIKKTAEATGDLIGNKIPDKTVLKSVSTELHSKKKSNNNINNNNNNNIVIIITIIIIIIIITITIMILIIMKI